MATGAEAGAGTVTLGTTEDQGSATLSQQDMEAMLRRLHERRERMRGVGDQGPSAPEGPLPPETIGIGDDAGAEGRPEAETAEAAGAGRLVIGANRRDPVANGPRGSTLAEPAAANNGRRVFATGNSDHAEFSEDGGVTWTPARLPAGPRDAPIPCCDQDVVIDDATKTVFHSALYLDESVSNGVVRLFVRKRIDRQAAACRYDIDPAGAADDILPDYPQIELTRRHLWLAINAGDFARMYRFDLDQLNNCRPLTNVEFFDQPSDRFGVRVWTPAGGANNTNTMYWLQHDDPRTLRIFSWSDGAARPRQVTRRVQRSRFANPDCRGGVGNFDYIERITSFEIFGFRTRCAVGKGRNQPDGILACYWHSAPTGGIRQGHVRSAVFDLRGLGLLAQPHIFSQSQCFGYPAVTGNVEGDLGLTIAFGGRAGGGGKAAQAAVGIDDPFTPGVGNFGQLRRTARGVANREDGRFGDYFTVQPFQPCDKWFTAANYAWDSAPVDSAEDVNFRYVEFGREKHRLCYERGRRQ